MRPSLGAMAGSMRYQSVFIAFFNPILDSVSLREGTPSQTRRIALTSLNLCPIAQIPSETLPAPRGLSFVTRSDPKIVTVVSITTIGQTRRCADRRHLFWHAVPCSERPQRRFTFKLCASSTAARRPLPAARDIGARHVLPRVDVR